MITEYTIENFKAFAGPATVPIKPITLIFGPNSSGKSSIFQSMLMLKQTIEDYTAQNPVLLPKGNFVDLGNYREFIFNHDINREFVVKIKAKHPEHLVYQAPDFFMNSRHDLCTILENSISNEDVGLSIGFQNSNSGEILLSDTQLFIGSNPNPIISYSCTYPQRKTLVGMPVDIVNAAKDLNIEQSLLLPKLSITKIDDDHPYWLKYCEQFGKIEKGYVKSFQEQTKEIPENEKRELMKKYGINPPITANDSNESNSEKLNEQDVLLILESNKKTWKEDFMLLKRFLPNTLYFQEIGELLSVMADENSVA